MQNAFDRITENLGKLRRNEEKMTPEQKIQYKNQLRRLRQKITEDALSMMWTFITGDLPLAKDDKDPEDWRSVIRNMEKIVDMWTEEGGAMEAVEILLKTYDTDRFLDALCPVYDEVIAGAYGDYWLKHTRKTGDAEFPYYNDIIRMYWWNASFCWVELKEEDGRKVVDHEAGFKLMLPPTRELIDDMHWRKGGKR